MKVQINIEGSRLEWCISGMIYSGYTPFWSETLDILQMQYTAKWINKQQNKAMQ